MNYCSEVNQRICGKLVEREVLACFSYEMTAILSLDPCEDSVKEADLPTWDDVDGVYHWVCPDCGEVLNIDEPEDLRQVKATEGGRDTEDNFVCPYCNFETEDEADFEQEPADIMEWWMVSGFLARKLREFGEPVLEWGNNHYWGRCTSGQSISIDYVIGQIAESMEILEGQKYDWSK